uniref:Small ribosomal subunit protein mS23 n=1 Tax=Strongyloides venezuelensis TaxID=75913 RepID=A0A0K0G3Y9_STRVS
MSSFITRAERSGSIFYRITGLIRGGQLKWEDRPMWYDVYAAHPPHHEPIWDAKMPKHGEPVRKILYPEDVERAKQFLENKSRRENVKLGDEE